MQADHHVSLGAIKKDALPLRSLFIGEAASDVTDQLGTILELVNCELRIWCLALVFVSVAAAACVDAHGQALVHPPAGQVDRMHAVVAQFAVAEVPKPMPVVVNQVALK